MFMNKILEFLRTKVGRSLIGAIVAVILAAFIANSIAESSRMKQEEADFQQAQEVFQTNVCNVYEQSLSTLTVNPVKKSALREISSDLASQLDSWETETSRPNDLFNRLQAYHLNLSRAILESKPENSKPLLAFEKAYFEELITTCGLESKYTYPTTLYFESGCWYWQDKTEVHLQQESLGKKWVTVAKATAETSSGCEANSNGADFDIDLGLRNTDLPNFKVVAFQNNRVIETISCTKLIDTVFSDCLNGYVWTEPESDDSSDSQDYVDNFPNPWEREFNDEWMEGTAKFTWCWNRGWTYDEASDSCIGTNQLALKIQGRFQLRDQRDLSGKGFASLR